MSNAKTVELGEVCKVVMGQSPPSSSYNSAKNGLPFFQGKTDFGELYPTARYFCNEPTRVAYRGDVLISVRAPVGPTNLASEQCCIGRGLSALQAHENLDPIYLLFFLRYFEPQLAQLGQGSTFEAINRDDLETLQIPLPSISKQKRIAGLLERADRLRRTRRYAIELSDTILQAAFLELFGDLAHNERNWGVRVLDEIADIASGIAKGQKYGNRETREVPYLRVANVQDGYLNLSEIKMIEALPGDVEHLRLQKGDIVMTEGGDFDKLGRGAIWPGGIKDCIHQNHIFRVRVNKSELLPEFFAAFLRSPAAKNYFLRCSKQTTNLASINMTQLRATPVALPPLPLQLKFADIVYCHKRLRATQRESLRQAKHLFQTLLHKAFTVDQ